MTPMIMPSRVSADRSLCAQIAAIASLRVSMNFTRLLRFSQLDGCERQKLNKLSAFVFAEILHISEDPTAIPGGMTVTDPVWHRRQASNSCRIGIASSTTHNQRLRRLPRP